MDNLKRVEACVPEEMELGQEPATVAVLVAYSNHCRDHDVDSVVQEGEELGHCSELAYHKRGKQEVGEAVVALAGQPMEED